MKRLLRAIRSIFFNEGQDINVRIMHIILVVMFFGSITVCVVSLAEGLPNVWINFLELGIDVFFLWLSGFRRKHRLVSILMSLTTSLVLIPLMHFEQCGIQGGMPMWIVFLNVMTLLICTGKISYLMFAISLCSTVGSIVIEQLFPEIITRFATESARESDIIQGIFIVSALFGCIIAYSLKQFRKQNVKLALQQKTLLNQQEVLEDMLKKAVAADKAKGTFLANMSHEIRTPINAIMGMDELIIRECKEKEIREYAENIQNASQTLLSLVNDILDFSKIESGKFEIIPNEYKTMDIFNDVYNMIKMKADEKNLELCFEPDKDIPYKLLGDEVRVRQIIINLLTNAVKYTKVGKITLTAKAADINGDTVRIVISVKDTGIGIKKQDIETLFDSFNRIDQKKNRSIEGTGLGLSITKSLVELMDGNIEVKSTYGEGSEFTVSILQKIISAEPMGNFVSKNEEKKTGYQTCFTAKNARIMVVDDVIMNIKVFTGLLKKTLVQVDTALNGNEALRLYCTNKYDIIFLDHMMPGMDGIETWHKMQEIKNSPNKKVPVIMLTANAILGAKDEYLAEGFTDYISKPVKKDELEKMVEHYLPKELID